MILTHIVSPEEEGLTLHSLLRGPMALSARQTQMTKAQGAVTVDTAPFFSNQKVSAGMVVRVKLDGYMPGSAPSAKHAQPLPGVEIIHEDEALLAVFKPALLQCHPSPSAPGGSDTLEARVSAHLGFPAHPVHRLDSETTGIVLFSKLPFAQAHLQQQMRAGTFSKRYEAWAVGCPAAFEGEIDAPIEREHPDSFTRIVRPDGQRAVSRYRVLQRLSLPDDTILSRIRFAPITGRTHQLRVHAQHIGCPLLGDTRYFTEESREVSQRLGACYHQLSAVQLSFIHPLCGEQTTLSHPAVFSFAP